MISTIFRHCVWPWPLNREEPLTGFLHLLLPSIPSNLPGAAARDQSSNQPNPGENSAQPGKMAAPALLHMGTSGLVPPGDPAGLEQGLGVRNIQGDFIVHLRIRITELEEKSQESEAPSSTVSRAASFISCCCGSTWIYIYTHIYICIYIHTHTHTHIYIYI